MAKTEQRDLPSNTVDLELDLGLRRSIREGELLCLPVFSTSREDTQNAMNIGLSHAYQSMMAILDLGDSWRWHPGDDIRPPRPRHGLILRIETGDRWIWTMAYLLSMLPGRDRI